MDDQPPHRPAHRPAHRLVPPLPSSPLTPDDIRLLQLLAAGASAAAASDLLHTSLHTTAQRLQSIRAAYRVTSTAHAIEQATAHHHLSTAPTS